MATIIDLTGQRFSRLTVIGRSEKKSAANALWLCVCDCGNISHVASLKLRSGKTVSCGCYRAENKPNLRHGGANKTPTYRTWKEMRQRCYNSNATQYKWYGGKGIAICDRWNSYSNFLLDMGERPEGKTIDRINPDKGYSPENCRWATSKEQAETNRGLFKKGQIPWNKRPF